MTPTTAATVPQMTELTAMPTLASSTVSRGTNTMVPKLEPMATTLMAWPCLRGNHMATRVPMPTKEPALRPPPTQHMAIKYMGTLTALPVAMWPRPARIRQPAATLAGPMRWLSWPAMMAMITPTMPATVFMFRMMVRSTPSRSATAGAMTLVPSAKKPPLLKKIRKPKISRNQPQAPKPRFVCSITLHSS